MIITDSGAWQIDALDHLADVPSEFHDAEVSQGLKSILKRPEGPRVLALVGPPGTGKTRALWALKIAWRRRRLPVGTEREPWQIKTGEYAQRQETRYECARRVVAEVDHVDIRTEVGDIRAHRYDRTFLAELTDCPCWLAVDDIGAIEPNEWVREAIYHTANERRAAGRMTIWTSNLTPQQIRDTFGGAIASRILGGEVIETSGADRRLVRA